MAPSVRKPASHPWRSHQLAATSSTAANRRTNGKRVRKSTTKSQPIEKQVPTAVSTVLGTFEILELILLHVPFLQLLVLRRVCRTWRDVITVNSSPLRKKIFLQPASVQEVSSLGIGEGTGGRSLMCYNTNMCQVRSEVDREIPTIGVLNPFFFKCNIVFDPKVSSKQVRRAIKRTNGLASRMLITQPPSKRIVFDFSYVKANDYTPIERELSTQLDCPGIIFAGGEKGAGEKPLIERLRGMEEHLKTRRGVKIDWSKAGISLEGQAMERSRLQFLLK